MLSINENLGLLFRKQRGQHIVGWLQSQDFRLHFTSPF